MCVTGLLEVHLYKVHASVAINTIVLMHIDGVQQACTVVDSAQ